MHNILHSSYYLSEPGFERRCVCPPSLGLQLAGRKTGGDEGGKRGVGESPLKVGELLTWAPGVRKPGIWVS